MRKVQLLVLLIAIGVVAVYFIGTTNGAVRKPSVFSPNFDTPTITVKQIYGNYAPPFIQRLMISISYPSHNLDTKICFTVNGEKPVALNGAVQPPTQIYSQSFDILDHPPVSSKIVDGKVIGRYSVHAMAISKKSGLQSDIAVYNAVLSSSLTNEVATINFGDQSNQRSLIPYFVASEKYSQYKNK